ncbi:hypothetical protein JZ751_017662 [Albula glossodonta]|uniref:Uncharacterized protein n=1 Tax=Albula glossodonta TaxID=121402 RepID=A0A8T2PLP8_9TELE|nr:hypothetical protein JZ751_017662 [Albula glossodonta]
MRKVANVTKLPTVEELWCGRLLEDMETASKGQFRAVWGEAQSNLRMRSLAFSEMGTSGGKAGLAVRHSERSDGWVSNAVCMILATYPVNIMDIFGWLSTDQ